MPSYGDHTKHSLPAGYRFSKLENFQWLTDLFSSVSRTEIPAAYFEKKYATAWTGVEANGLMVIEPGGRPAAFIGTTPAFVEYNGKKEIWSQVTDIITHPDHRRLGLFHALVPALVEQSRQAGINMLYGFPNENSYRILTDDFGWQQIGQLNRFEIPVQAGIFQKLKRKLAGREKSIEKIMHHDQVQEKGVSVDWSAQGFGGIVRDNDYLHYKKFNGGFVVKAATSLAWVNLRRGCWIGELSAQTASACTESLHALIKLAAGWGENQLLFHVSSETNLHNWLKAGYKPLSSFPVLGFSLGSELPADKIKFSLADIDIF